MVPGETLRLFTRSLVPDASLARCLGPSREPGETFFEAGLLAAAARASFFLREVPEIVATPDATESAIFVITFAGEGTRDEAREEAALVGALDGTLEGSEEVSTPRSLRLSGGAPAGPFRRGVLDWEALAARGLTGLPLSLPLPLLPLRCLPMLPPLPPLPTIVPTLNSS